MSDFFWFSDDQWSGIVHALQSGGRWGDCPEHVYGPKRQKTELEFEQPPTLFGR